MKQDKIEDSIKTILREIEGKDVLREGLVETPNRIYRMYRELFGGYDMSPSEILGKRFGRGRFASKLNEITVKDIHFYSMCEHHMMPFFGTVSITYRTEGPVVGLSKLCRLVECFARRLQIQERMTQQIADALNAAIQPDYVEVVIEAEHLCMAARGVNKPGTKTVTRAIAGGKDEQ